MFNLKRQLINSSTALIACTSLIFSFTLAACEADSEPQATEQQTTSTEVKSSEGAYKVRGQIVTSTIDGEAPEEQALVVDHEPVKGMKSMRMTLQVSDSTQLKELASGDKISFEMVERDGEYMMKNIEKLPPETDLQLEGLQVKVPLRPDKVQ